MPWWVPFVFIYCLFIGYMSSKPRTASPYFLFVPLIGIPIFLFRFYSIPLLMGFAPSILLGYFWGSKENVQVHEKSITIPGSWVPMVLVMLIFFTKFTFGWLKALMPEVAQQYKAVEGIVQGSVVGSFLGRFLNFFYRYWKQYA